MQSVAVLGFGVIALTTGAFITASAAAGSRDGTVRRPRASFFEAAVDGALEARPSGEVAFGIVGDSASGMAAFSITLGAGGSAGAILFTGLDGRVPAPGRYEVTGDPAAASGGFRATYVGGSAERPTGLFRGKHGTLDITASAADQISGRFRFTGTGFTTANPSEETAEITVSGAFSSTHSAPASRPAQP